MTLTLADGQTFVFQETMAVNSSGMMMLSWDNTLQGIEFYCPWYRSYDTALSESNWCYDSNGNQFP